MSSHGNNTNTKDTNTTNSNNTTTSGQPTDVLDEGARIYGWTTLFLKRVLPGIFQQKNFHFKRKTDRPIKEGTIFLTELARRMKVPLLERKKDELVQVLVDRIATMPHHEIPAEIVVQIPPNPWTMIQAKDKKVEDDVTMATINVTKEELMSNFQQFPDSFLELVYHLREDALWPDDNRAAVWMGDHFDSIFILNRNNILRALAKKDTKRWTLPPPFFDADLPVFDAELGPAPTLGLVGGGISPWKQRKKPLTGSSSGVGLIAGSRGHKHNGVVGSGNNNNKNNNDNNGVSTDLVTAALNFVGTQQQAQSKRASNETMVYWKHKEDIELENVKRARIDAEVHRFQVLADILPTIEDTTTRDELHHELQQQKAEFCRRLLLQQQQHKGDEKKQTTEEEIGAGGGGDSSSLARPRDL